MLVSRELNDLLNVYCRLRDRQFAVYTRYAKQHDLTANELFVLDILWFASEGCTQKEICDRLSANKQTIAAITGRLMQKGYIVLEEVAEDRRNKRILLTNSGKRYVGTVIPPAAEADNIAFAALGLQNAEELVRLTTTLTENMEKEFSKSEQN